MLVLTRKAGDAIVIGENGEIVITVLCVKGSQIKIGVEAPQNLAVNREEIWERILAAKQEAVSDNVGEAA